METIKPTKRFNLVSSNQVSVVTDTPLPTCKGIRSNFTEKPVKGCQKLVKPKFQQCTSLKRWKKLCKKKSDILYPCDFHSVKSSFYTCTPLDAYAKMGFKKLCITIMSSFFILFSAPLKVGDGLPSVTYVCVCYDKWGYQCVFACMCTTSYEFFFFLYEKRFVSISLSRGYICIQRCCLLLSVSAV